MLDIRFIRENAQLVQENARVKGYDVNIEELLRHDQTKRQLQQQVDELREKRNEISSRMKGSRPSDELIAEGKAVKDELTELESTLKDADRVFTDLLKKVPNMALSDVPVGLSEDENVVSKTVGKPFDYDFEPKNHAQIAEAKGWIDTIRDG
jgi:seryl-tRNA synthetase